MKINKSKLLRDLQIDLRAAEVIKREWDSKREGYLNETYAKPYGNEIDGKSKIISKDIKRQLEWLIPSISDPFLSTQDVIKCSPVTFEDAASARQNELLLNTQFCRKFPRYNFVNKAARVLATEGTVTIQTGWEYEEEEVAEEVEVVAVDMYGQQYVTTETQTVTKVVKNQPTAVVCRNEDIYLDPTCMDDMDKCQFIIYRYQTDMSTLKADGRYKNLDKIRDAVTGYDTTYVPEDSTRFNFNDEARKKMVVYEYWGNYDLNEDGIAEPIICSWVGNTIIRLEENPYPDKKPPFVIVPFNPIPFQMYGEALAENIGDNQKVKTAITRGLIDNMARSNNGQIGMRRGALDLANRKKFLQGKNFEFNGTPADFWQGSYNQIPSSAFDMMALMNNEIEAQTGVKSFSGGINGNALGNMLDIDTDIPMADGSWKKLADIEDGDVIVGSDGRGTIVLKAHEIKFPETAYDMAFDNGSVVKSGGEHLWTVKVHGTKHSLREWTTMDADEVYKHIQKGRRVTIPAMKEMRAGTTTGNSIDPYVLGFWLGDGMSHSARITCADKEVVMYFDEAGYECVEVRDSSKCGEATMYDVYKKGTKQTFDKDGNFTSNGSLHSELRELGLHARYGGEKHIPEEYFSATYEEKMELIRGLMDSDGFAHSGSFVQFAQSEGRLKDDFIKLIESLGLKVSIHVKDMDTMNKQKLAHSERTGTKMIWARKDAYEIGFTPWTNPFKLKRKADKWKKPTIETVRLKSMEVVDKVLMRCLTVDSKDKLFAVTDKFTLTHNTATAARGAMDATSMRRLHLVRNVSENMMKPLFRKWMSYNAEFLEEEEVVRITNEEFVPIRRDDLNGKIDIDLSISTQEDDAAKVQQISFLLQTIGPNEDPSIRRELMADIYELSRMPDKAERIRNYQPEPDPMQQQMQQMQIQKLALENQKLQAEIQDLMARAGENEIDAQVKQAKMQVEIAKARKLGSEADMNDLNFVRADEQIDATNAHESKQLDREMKMAEIATKLKAQMASKQMDAEYKAAEKERDRQHQLQLVLAQAKAGDNNIGVR